MLEINRAINRNVSNKIMNKKLHKFYNLFKYVIIGSLFK
jgi:hypothetical protein